MGYPGKAYRMAAVRLAPGSQGGWLQAERGAAGGSVLAEVVEVQEIAGRNR
jgi:hypothetical protein